MNPDEDVSIRRRGRCQALTHVLCVNCIDIQRSSSSNVAHTAGYIDSNSSDNDIFEDWDCWRDDYCDSS